MLIFGFTVNCVIILAYVLATIRQSNRELEATRDMLERANARRPVESRAIGIR